MKTHYLSPAPFGCAVCEAEEHEAEEREAVGLLGLKQTGRPIVSAIQKMVEGGAG